MTTFWARAAPLLACSILVLLQWPPSTDGTPQRQQHQGPSEEAGAVRAKRQLIGTPSLPLMTDPRRKRPFCNAFTGCGRKRSEGEGRRLSAEEAPGAVAEEGAAVDESMGTLVELNSEPAVAELSRQILSEAKLWEAIQEARQEIARRRQEQAAVMLGQRLVDRHPRAGGALEAALASGVRKRRDAPDLAPPPIPKGTLPSAGHGALPVV